MKKVLFICYGNICRSVSAEYIMKDLAKKNGVDLYVSSMSLVQLQVVKKSVMISILRLSVN